MEELINKIETIDKDFNKTDFISLVDNTIIMLFTSIQLEDINRVKHKISDDLYNKLKELVNNLINNNLTQIYDELNVKSTNITNINILDNYYEIEVQVILRYMDYKINRQTKKYVGGDNTKRVEKTYNLLFRKNILHKNKGIINKCPSCNASLDINNTGKCPYCGSIFDTFNYDFILESINI